MRKLLVVVDMQNDFIDGSLGTAEAVQIVDNVVDEIGKYDVKDVFATRDTHPENYLEIQEGKNLPVVHCVKGTFGWQINEKVAAALGTAEIIDKPTFGSRTLAEKIAAKPPVALRKAKEVLVAASEQLMQQTIDMESEAIRELWDTEDKTEAVTAFLEKRSPQFQGK